MVMSSLPCPPLPMMISKELWDEDGYVGTVDHVSSSHDLIAHMIQKSLHIKESTFHVKKEMAQASAISSLNKAMDELIKAKVTSTQKLYEAFQKFTRDYIQAFLPYEKYLDLRFKPYTDVLEADSILKRARDFVRAQDILYGSHRNPFNVEIMTYEQVLQLSGLRFLD